MLLLPVTYAIADGPYGRDFDAKYVCDYRLLEALADFPRQPKDLLAA